MSKGNTFETELLDHILNNANVANVGDATGLRGSSTPGSLYVSLHTSDPGEAGDQTSNETGYGGYARVAVARSGAAWTVTSGTAENAGTISFPTVGSGSGTFTHFGVGTASAGSGKLLYKGTISGGTFSAGVTPTFPAGDLAITED